MIYWLMAASIGLAWASTYAQSGDQDGQREESQTATSQPATRPADSQPTFRKPDQTRILEELLRRKEAPARIRQTHPESERGAGAEGGGRARQDRSLLVDGSPVSERPGRFLVADGRPVFSFHPDKSFPTAQTMEILKNQYLEIMEDEAKAGVSEFVVSGEVTSYRGQNYLLIGKLLRRVPNRNLSP